MTNGLEKSWIVKLTALTAPVRITPTDAYYNSYFYQIDKVSEEAGYSTKTIREKLESSLSDPYNPEIDQELPPTFPSPDLNEDGILKIRLNWPMNPLKKLKMYLAYPQKILN